MKGSVSPTEPLPPPRDTAEARLRALYRLASPTEKLAVIARLNASLTAIKEAALRQQHPEWSPRQRHAALRRWWLSARD